MKYIFLIYSEKGEVSFSLRIFRIFDTYSFMILLS